MTPEGSSSLAEWDIDVAAARAARRVFARACLDWTERRYHLAGSLAAHMAAQLVDGASPWFVRRTDDHRGLRLTDLGRRRMDELAPEVGTRR